MATSLLLVASPAVAASSASRVALEIRATAVLEANPGGQEIAPGIVSWGNGAVVLTLDGAVSPQAVGTCATGQYCAWSETSYIGTKLAFTACSAGGTSSSLALLGGVVRSTANARSSGTVKAKNGSTVVYTMAANTGKAVNISPLSTLVCNT
jgi:hypothetical protein